MLFSMIQNVNEQRRYTTLALRLDQIANESEESGPMDDLGILKSKKIKEKNARNRHLLEDGFSCLKSFSNLIMKGRKGRDI